MPLAAAHGWRHSGKMSFLRMYSPPVAYICSPSFFMTHCWLSSSTAAVPAPASHLRDGSPVASTRVLLQHLRQVTVPRLHLFAILCFDSGRREARLVYRLVLVWLVYTVDLSVSPARVSPPVYVTASTPSGPPAATRFRPLADHKCNHIHLRLIALPPYPHADTRQCWLS